MMRHIFWLFTSLEIVTGGLPPIFNHTRLVFSIFGLSIMLISCGEDEGGDKPEKDLIQVSISDANTEELNENFTVSLEVSLADLLAEDIIVHYKTQDGSAVAGEDYTETSGVITFEPGDFTKNIEVEIIGDLKKEPLEAFAVLLYDASENATISKKEGVISISDSDTHTDSLIIPETGYITPETYEGMTLAWSDEFDGQTLNPDDWTYEIGGHGWGNNELEYYTNENTSIVEGNLVIEAREESKGGKKYTSSRIVTQGKQEFKYGRIDIRAVLPQGQGIWPALWMLGSNFKTVGWPACGEIDIMEMIGGSGREKTVHGTLHWSNAGSYASYGGGYSLNNGIFADEFHVFSIIWDEATIKWYVDDVHFHTIDISPAEMSEFRQEFFFIFNVAVGGNWPGSPNSSTFFPQRMIVDYVRVFNPN